MDRQLAGRARAHPALAESHLSALVHRNEDRCSLPGSARSHHARFESAHLGAASVLAAGDRGHGPKRGLERLPPRGCRGVRGPGIRPHPRRWRSNSEAHRGEHVPVKSRLRKRALVVLFGVLIAWALAEVVVLTLLRHPSVLAKLPAGMLLSFRRLYMMVDRPIIQYDPNMATYDPELFYTLKPGRFVFEAREFSTEYSVNSLGVRDDERSLDKPEIVVIGDSFAMGWAVQQEEAFPQLIERKTG